MTKLINDKLIHLGGIRLLAIIINPAMDILWQVLFLFLLGIYLEVELLGQMVTLFVFQSVSYIPPVVYEVRMLSNQVSTIRVCLQSLFDTVT